MRTLTLGVLIVSGGTLAALPFRKYQAIPDASSAPVQVTGPTQSALESDVNTQLVTTDSSSEQPSDDASDENFVAMDTRVLTPNLSRWEPNAPAPLPRNADIPLTYEDLVLPIDPPPPIAQRFNATIPIRQQQLEKEQVAALVMPAMEQLAVTQQLELQRVAESVEQLSQQRTDSKAAGSLASSRDASEQRLPQAAPVNRDRHWIHQPE